jgi:prevent-host-death family protein
MAIAVSDIVPFTHARANLSALVDQAMGGAETIITKDGRPAAALIDAHKLDHYHRLENAAIHMLWLTEAEKGLADVAAGRSSDARASLAAIQTRRAKNARAITPPVDIAAA